METMQVHILFGQRIGSYPGQYAPEAIAVTDEWSSEDSPEWIHETKAENEATGEFESLAIITFEVSLEEIKKRLSPNLEPVAAKIV